jgi:hypothetical protein
LGAGDEHVDPPGVHRKIDRTQGGNGVHDEEAVGLRLHEIGDVLDGVIRARRTLGGLNEDSLIAPLLQTGLDLLHVHGPSPGHLDHVRLDAVGLADLPPPLAELAAVHNDDLVTLAQGVHDRALHRAGAGRRQDQDLVLGLKEPFQAITDLRDDLLEGLRPVMDNGAGHRERSLFRDGRGARCE